MRRNLVTSITLLLLVLSSPTGHCQEIKIPPGWTVIEITELGSIAIPPTMELREDDSYISQAYDTFIDSYSKIKIIEIKKPNITFQPKGVNDLQKDAISKYSRILITVEKGDAGEFISNNELINLTKSEVEELNSMYRQNSINDFSKLGGQAKLVEWYPIKVVTINGMAALRISYKRQAMNNPIVFVQAYNFLNYDERVEITLSYRETEEDLWKEDFTAVINTFRFTNKR